MKNSIFYADSWQIIYDPNFQFIAGFALSVWLMVTIAIVLVYRHKIRKLRALTDRYGPMSQLYEYFKGSKNWGTIKIMDGRNEGVRTYRVWIGDDNLIPKEE